MIKKKIIYDEKTEFTIIPDKEGCSIGNQYLRWKIIKEIHHTSKYNSKLQKKGIVKWFDFIKGFGFIVQNNGMDIFVHQNQIYEGIIEEGDSVDFEIGDGKKGKYAINVKKIDDVISNINEDDVDVIWINAYINPNGKYPHHDLNQLSI
jgi:CspA family cold shock protein